MAALTRTWPALCVAVLTGCVTTGSIRPAGPPDRAAWVERRDAISALEHWQLRGRAAIKVADDGWNASVRWRQRGEQLRFSVNGPLGVGGADIDGALNERLHVVTSKGEEFDLDDPVTDMRVYLGWSAPLHSMRYWILGLPDPGGTAERRIDSGGRLAALSQNGWHVTYTRYRRFGDVELPSRLTIEGGDVRIRMAVDRFSLEDAGGSH